MQDYIEHKSYKVIGKAPIDTLSAGYFEFCSHSYGTNKRSKKINSVDLANELKASL